MSETETTDDSSTNASSTSNTSSSGLKSAVAKLIPSNRCDKAIFGFYFTLFLLLLIMTGIALQEADSQKGVGWALFSFSIILGLLAHFFLLKGGSYKKYGVPIFSIMITIMLMVSLILTKPKGSTSSLAVSYITVILFGIVSTVAAVLT
jgi:hypothetical protein